MPLTPTSPKKSAPALILAAAFVASCGEGPRASATNVRLAPVAQLPAELLEVSPAVREAYQFAAANPDVLERLPCYCGCGGVGHASNYACFVSSVEPSGAIVYDGHAVGCSICVDIARDAMRLLGEGQDLQAIRTHVDHTYGRYGPSNMTR